MEQYLKYRKLDELLGKLLKQNAVISIWVDEPFRVSVSTVKRFYCRNGQVITVDLDKNICIPLKF